MRKVLSFCFLFLMLVGCKEETPYVITCSDGAVPIEQFSGRFTSVFRFKNDIDSLKQRKFVIRNEIEWRSYIEGSSFGGLPELDFERKTIILGRKFHSTNSPLVEQNIVSNCESKELTYHVTMKEGNEAVNGNTYYYAIIPKISDDTKVNVVVTYKE
ncbi:hypothetical protein [Dyadobacter pollutisoli]|uniref:Lipoprotein n=1 Tax=Dyadobacter pollutisoli TaxID=2910158 RepID=A0A9E8NDA6_9BACT|nr:hypothetical protein [Dyadobacter pollutisoli]WAC14614.1 hypothetical protein ON006_11760 [Dyadobacter pollutisoli]